MLKRSLLVECCSDLDPIQCVCKKFSPRLASISHGNGVCFFSHQMACSNIRYGAGVTQEVGMDLANLGAKNVGVYTDKNLAGEEKFHFQIWLVYSNCGSP